MATSIAYSMRTPLMFPDESCACRLGQDRRTRTASAVAFVTV